MIKKTLFKNMYSFTVVYAPVGRGYQVTVPLLPGLVTYGRNFEEAKDMAKDAINCHLESLRKDREPIPVEQSLLQERLTVSLVWWCMSKLPPMRPKQAIQVLLRAGFFIHNQIGSHVHLRHPIKNYLKVTVPRHDRFNLPTYVVISILKQAELSKDEFIRLLKNKHGK